jgi:hypothetical protein
LNQAKGEAPQHVPPCHKAHVHGEKVEGAFRLVQGERLKVRPFQGENAGILSQSGMELATTHVDGQDGTRAGGKKVLREASCRGSHIDRPRSPHAFAQAKTL